ncbi:uncharacterized protein ARMOST_14217 [Armillaria ostoyae]|uniref:Uncharacterized protein n=1 Tax=Armillaria ostoyae TaxID=47428 RepID=A0A284RQ02_ARMOS|nr:uncharacterized protein ARMOST_14217 [Armillaria ostoyae]
MCRDVDNTVYGASSTYKKYWRQVLFTGRAIKDALRGGGESGGPGRLPVFESKRDLSYQEIDTARLASGK